MAQPTAQKSQPLPEPEVRAWTIIHRGPAMWAMREYVIRGNAVTYTDSDPDSKAPTIGRIIRRVERVNP